MTDKNIVPEAEVLETEDCWRLLGETTIGRLSVIVNGHPDIFPVNFAVDNKTIVFRTGPGTKQWAMEDDAVVAIETDSVSAEFGIAWSVVVKGGVEEAGSEGPRLDEIRRALFPWQGVGQDHLFRIVPDSVTGRRFDLSAPMSLTTPLNDATRAGLE
ncbi:pyridoxamine 5'-phosphate oxidase family protein [Paenarthrobacter aurescens]|uniref:pyridoxamine 5'-phosphate oxidase family protein n=1 Tax=Paenarthrobacter aurescens TaxID=43663 RepID=UPI0021C03CF5|nr:pyridoxamine 5'-phosphate oxidase family protein [Paenarthrobacter aurescens]MCT9868234.1 pyridoxamine 5'-phosphate oxidase family protein [Paenarthrobacter aurescens]